MIANNQDEFSETIKTCISDEDYCKDIGINARKLIEENHDINKITVKLVDFFKKVMIF